MERYSEISYKIMNIFKDFSPDVDQMSIDEAFIDISGTEDLFGKPEEIAFKIKKIIKETQNKKRTWHYCICWCFGQQKFCKTCF